MRKMLIVLASLAVALSACEMRAEIDVQANGSGTLSMVLGLPKNLGPLAGITGVNPLDSIREQARSAPFPVTVEDYENNRVSGFRMSIPFRDTEDLKDKLLQMQQLDAFGAGNPFADLPSDLPSEFSDFQEELPDPSESLRNMVLECSAGACRFVLGAATLPVGEGLEGLQELTEGILSLIDVQFRVSLPGRPGETNATAFEKGCDRTTFIWKASMSSSPSELTAETLPGGACFPVVPVAAGAGAAALIGLAVFLARRRPQAAVPPPMDGTIAPPPGPSEPMPPPPPPDAVPPPPA